MDIPLANIDQLTYNTIQDGFLGGYLPAGMTNTGKVATFGGIELPIVREPGFRASSEARRLPATRGSHRLAIDVARIPPLPGSGLADGGTRARSGVGPTA